MEVMTLTWMVLFLALVFSVLLTPFSMYLARMLGAIDSPNERSAHADAIPRLGGVGIGLSVLFAIAFYMPVSKFSFGFLIGLAVIFFVGLLDDIKPMSHRLKFVGEIVAAVFFVSISGSELSEMGNLLGFGEIILGSFSFIVTVFCIVGVINALNLSDGLDGLAGGLAIIASLFFALLAYMSGQQEVLIIALAMAGALLGFLMYNSFPARLFMGDTGSLMIGYTCATIAVHLTNGSDTMSIQPISIALILAVPLLDTLVVMGARILQGKSPFLPDNTHLHHRLMDMGLNQNQAVSFLYILMFLYGSLAFIGLNVDAFWQFYGAIVLIALVYFFISKVRDYPWSVVSAISKIGSFMERLELQQHESLAGIWRYFRNGIPIIILLFFFQPLFFMDGEVLVQIWMLLLTGMILFLSLRYENVRIYALLYGLLYLSIFLVLSSYQFLHQNWLQSYCSVLAYVSIIWIILSLFIGHSRKILALHSFEILLVLSSWFGAFVFVPLLEDSATLTIDMRMVCIYAIPLLMITKLSLSVVQDYLIHKRA